MYMCVYIYLSIYLSIDLSMYLYLYLSIYLSTYPGGGGRPSSSAVIAPARPIARCAPSCERGTPLSSSDSPLFPATDD